jgi:hypothetical protein
VDSVGGNSDDHIGHEHCRTHWREQADRQTSAAGELNQRHEDRVGVRKRDVRLSQGLLHRTEVLEQKQF